MEGLELSIGVHDIGGSPFSNLPEVADANIVQHLLHHALYTLEESTASNDLYLPMSVAEFEHELRARYAMTHPELVYRTEVTIQRARLERPGLPNLPRMVLRQGAPPRG